MGYTGDRCYVRCQLDDGELLCQLAEEAIELAKAAGEFEESYFDAYCLGCEKELQDEVIEEIADVELVLSILMRQDETEALLETLKKVLGEVSGNAKEAAAYYHDVVVPAMEAVRLEADNLEMLTDKSCWPYPTYSDLL